MLFVRKREFKTKRGIHGTFLELFFEVRNDRLCVPVDGVPSRFRGRTTQLEPGLFLVESKGAPCGLRTRANIVTDGFWAIESDWMPTGGLVGQVPFESIVYGIRIEPPMSMDDWKRVLRVTHCDVCVPIVQYHGTRRDNIKSIVENGIQPSYGMFGTAAYVGTFWKAFRFATLTQDYQMREGAIFRCLVLISKSVIRNADVPVCECTNCRGAPTFADHTQAWKTRGDAVFMLPAMLNGAWVVRNTEVALADTVPIVLESVGHARRTSATHMPLDRTSVIV
jgi:hypothetical protein